VGYSSGQRALVFDEDVHPWFGLGWFSSDLPLVAAVEDVFADPVEGEGGAACEEGERFLVGGEGGGVAVGGSSARVGVDASHDSSSAAGAPGHAGGSGGSGGGVDVAGGFELPEEPGGHGLLSGGGGDGSGFAGGVGEQGRLVGHVLTTLQCPIVRNPVFITSRDRV